MKLWLKQTLLALLIILLSVSACLYLFVAHQVDGMLDAAAAEGEKSLDNFCVHIGQVAAAENNGRDGQGDDVTRRALAHFVFSTYAHSFQSLDEAFSLVIDGQYLYNVSSLQPLEQLPLEENAILASRMIVRAGQHFLIVAKPLEVLNMTFAVYYTKNITAVFDGIQSLTRTAQVALLGCLLASALVLPLVMRGTLAKLRQLTHTAEHIAGGEYHLRSGIDTKDEVGELSGAFDGMAEAIEQKIATLLDTAKRQELLLGALTHEMKTPMTSIIGFSDSLLKMPLTEEKRLEAAHEIHEAAQRTERLSGKMMQLIALAECPALNKRKLDIAELFDQAQKMTAHSMAEKGVALHLAVEAPVVWGDQDLLLCLLTNLLDNAAKASVAGKEIILHAFIQGDRVCLQVSDQGCGIPADKLALVTEPFYRVDKARSRTMGGAGLGLSLCRMIAQVHGGKLEINSTLGKGTTISTLLPKEDCCA